LYKIHLILKYLFKRRIAWVSLLAVALCTLMVLVVISVMGGWLNMFKSSFRGLSGDIVIRAGTLKGFPYYEEIIDAIKKDPQCQVEAAVPSIETAGLFNHGTGPIPVRVMGMKIAEIDKVDKFGQSLYLQSGIALDEALHPVNPNAPKPSQAELDRLRRAERDPPSFDLLDEVRTPLASLPPGLKYATAPQGKTLPPGAIATPDTFPKELKNRLRYDALRHELIYRGDDLAIVKVALKSLSKDPAFQKAIDALAAQVPFAHYENGTGKFNGLIVGTGVIGIQRNHNGEWERPGQLEWQQPTSLTVLDLSSDHISAEHQVTRNFFIVDDSHLGVWQYDSSFVYVSFDVLQADLGLTAQPFTTPDGKAAVEPARATDIHIKMKPGIDPNDEPQLQAARKHIEDVVHRVLIEEIRANPYVSSEIDMPKVETWQSTQRVFISAIENEKLLTVVLFGIMCVVAIFLIFCIFYMIVVEKTRDIGIIKSVGATSAGVAGIFLGYGLVIGVIGAGLGLILSYLVVHNINALHALLGRLLHVQIWNPQVYVFDKIPNEMSGSDIAWIIPIAILASVLGALIPAIRAGRLNPVDSLRWE
jgi:lipoprotein-releasing system permease protein